MDEHPRHDVPDAVHVPVYLFVAPSRVPAEGDEYAVERGEEAVGDEADVASGPCLAEERIEPVEHGPLDGVQCFEQTLVYRALQHEVGHHLEVLFVLGQVGEEYVRSIFQPWSPALRDVFGELIQEMRGPPEEGLHEEVLLVGEVPVDEGGGDTRFLRDVPHAHFREGFRGEDLLCSIHDHVPHCSTVLLALAYGAISYKRSYRRITHCMVSQSLDRSPAMVRAGFHYVLRCTGYRNI